MKTLTVQHWSSDIQISWTTLFVWFFGPWSKISDHSRTFLTYLKYAGCFSLACTHFCDIIVTFERNKPFYARTIYSTELLTTWQLLIFSCVWRLKHIPSGANNNQQVPLHYTLLGISLPGWYIMMEAVPVLVDDGTQVAWKKEKISVEEMQLERHFTSQVLVRMQ